MKNDSNGTQFWMGDTVIYKSEEYIVWFAMDGESNPYITLIPKPYTFQMANSKDVTLKERLRTVAQKALAEVLQVNATQVNRTDASVGRLKVESF